MVVGCFVVTLRYRLYGSLVSFHYDSDKAVCRMHTLRSSKVIPSCGDFIFDIFVGSALTYMDRVATKTPSGSPRTIDSSKPVPIRHRIYCS